MEEEEVDYFPFFFLIFICHHHYFFLVYLWVLCAFGNSSNISPTLLLAITGKNDYHTHPLSGNLCGVDDDVNC